MSLDQLRRLSARAALVSGLALTLGANLLASPPAVLAFGQTFIVNKSGDAADLKTSDGICDSSTKRGKQCTLRAAIQQANATGGANVINFNLPAGSLTIAPKSALPAITDSGLHINGYSQSGSAMNTQRNSDNAVLKVGIDGVGAGSSTTGLSISGDSVVVQGLVIGRFGGDGVDVTGTSDSLLGNFIGTDASGASARSNHTGINVNGPNAVIGGSLANRNLISGNGLEGIRLSATIGGHGDGAQVSFNFIGVNAAGDATVGNGRNGMVVSGSSNTIGGTTADSFNLISGNGGDGIQLVHAGSATVQNNIIGSQADKTGVLPNSGNGIQVQDSIANEIGPANFISRNSLDGVLIASGTGTEVQGNTILTNGQYGVETKAGSQSIHDNSIQHNGKDGIAVTTASATGVQIVHNSEVGNTGLGINLVGGTEDSFGVTANDANSDPDTGANNLQNFPLITSAVSNKTTNKLTVSGTITGPSNEDFLVEVYIVSDDPSGHGEGQGVVASVQVHIANNATSASWQLTGLHANPGLKVTATATFLEDESTSEFGPNFTITGT